MTKLSVSYLSEPKKIVYILILKFFSLCQLDGGSNDADADADDDDADDDDDDDDEGEVKQ